MVERRFSKAEILLLDALCDQFEGAANRGERPRIEDFLPKAPEEIQQRLFAELLQVEIAGDSKSDSSCDTYIERFPQYAHVVRENWPDRAEATITTAPSGKKYPEELDASSPNDPKMSSARSFASASKESRYSIIKTHAKGGLGEVFVAEDRDLHRRVAVKEIQPFAADDPESRARFLLEAEITGRLEHPGIVPVYSLGAREDGRPYYAMRFIQGVSLKEAIEKHHATKFQSDSEKAVEFRQLLTRFVAVCQAVAFAHDRGILHRDIKPANIMLGKFGETLVVDWGLAKVLGKSAPGSGEHSALIPKGKDDSSETRHGAVVGTPAYMSPEQARGEVDGLAPAADIYSLGATLFSIATGERPVQGQSTAELLRNVRDGKTELENRIYRGINPPLMAICKRAMAREPADRFQTALSLAADVERWLADEPVEAFRESAIAQMRRWIKRHTTAVSTASAALVVLLLTLAGGSIGLSFKNTELQEANRKQTLATQAAEKARKAEARARKASDLAREAAEEAKRKSDRAQHAAEKAQKQSEIAQKAAEQSAKEEKQANAIAQARLAQLREHNLVLKDIFADINPNIGTTGGATLSAQLAKRLIEASKRLNADSVDDAVYVSDLQSSLGNALENLGYPKEAVELHRKALETSIRVSGAEHPNTLTCMDNLATALRASTQVEESISLYEKTLELRRKHLGPNHQDTMQTLNNLANSYESAGDSKKAVEMLETAFAVLKNSLGEEHHETLVAMSNLAGSYLGIGEYSKAVEQYQKVHDLWLSKHGSEHALVVGAKSNLGFALINANQHSKAVPILEEAIAAAKTTLGEDHPTTLAAMNNAASALTALGQIDRAIVLHEETVARKKAKFGDDHPGTLASMSGLASAYRTAQQFDKALALFETTLDLKRKRYPEDHSEYLRTLSAYAFTNLMAKRFDKAQELFEKSYAASKAKYGEKHPETMTDMHNLSLTYLRGGNVEKGKSFTAEYVDLRRKSAAPGDLKFIEFLWEFGNEHFSNKRFTEAEQLLSECLLLRKQYGKEPWRVFATQSLLGAAMVEQQKYADGERLLLEAYEGLRQSENEIPPKSKKTLPNAVARLIKLYEAQAKPEETARWTTIRDELSK